MEIKHKKRSYSNNELVRRKITEKILKSSLEDTKTNNKPKPTMDQDVNRFVTRSSNNSPVIKRRQVNHHISRSVDIEIGSETMSQIKRQSPVLARKERLDLVAVKLKNLPPSRSLENIMLVTERLKQSNRNSGSSFIASDSEEDSITWSYQSDSEELVDLSPLKQRRGASRQKRKRSRTADETDYARKKSSKTSLGLNEPSTRNHNEIKGEIRENSFMKQRARQLRLMQATQRYLISRGMLVDPEASSSEWSDESVSSYRSSFDTTELESTCRASPVIEQTLPVTRVTPKPMQMTATVTPVTSRPPPAVEKVIAQDSKATRVSSAPQMTRVTPTVTPLELSPVLKRQRTQLNLTVKFDDEPTPATEASHSGTHSLNNSPRAKSRLKLSSSKEKLFDKSRDDSVNNTNVSPRKKTSLPNLASIGGKAKKLLKRLSSKNLFKGHKKTKSEVSPTSDSMPDTSGPMTPVTLSSSLPSNFTSRSSPASPVSSPPTSARKEKSDADVNTYSLNLAVFNSVDPHVVQTELDRKEARRTRLKRMMFQMQRSATLATLQSVKSKKKDE